MFVHVVSHTHWDREWYHTAERFRQGLVALVDELLDDPTPGRASFLLDGQTVVLEDYLEVQPERVSELAKALRDGKIEAGPWFVLPDELIPSGEGLVRNLLAGRRTLRALRAESPPVLYCPDSFGHPAALPMLAQGFDKFVIVLWRGFGSSRAPQANTLWWTTPSRARVLLYHLSRSGYELGGSLPIDREAVRARWVGIREELATRSNTDVVLLLNGADHHARQRDLATTGAVLAEIASPDRVRASTLAEFARDLSFAAKTRQLPEITGEQRDSYGFTWTLQGTLGSRTPQKRRYAVCERELVRDVEPWAAFAALYRGRSHRPLVRVAWRPLLLCQPHDTLCGTSIDDVALAMDQRLRTVAAQAEGLRQSALFDLLGHDPDASRAGMSRWQSLLVVRNRAARPRNGVALVTLTMKVADVPVGPGSAHVALPVKAKSSSPAHLAPLKPIQVLDVVRTYERTEAPRAYPDNDAVVRVHAAVWMPEVPAYGVSAVPLAGTERMSPPIANTVAVKGRSISNALVSVRWDGAGRIAFVDHIARREIRRLLEWESRHDHGDLYTPSVRGVKLKPRLAGSKVLHRGPLRATLEQRFILSAQREKVELKVLLTVEAASRCVRVRLAGENNARDHRLRLLVRTDVHGGKVFADAAFGPVVRPSLTVPAREAKMEAPVPTAPLHRYVSVFDARNGATLFSDGLTEYESLKDGIAVTLLRSVGELSRSDLPERPGHAGWPASTPGAQNVGPFEAELGLLLHGPRTPATIDEIERAADDVLLPLVGDTLRSALSVPAAIHGAALDGRGLAFSSVKESEEGEWLILRCVNLLDEETSGSWKLEGPIQEAYLARLDETRLSRLRPAGQAVSFTAPARGAITILVR